MLRNTVRPEKKAFARELRKRATHAERQFWQLLRKCQLGIRFRRQSVLRGYIADFYAPRIRLVVEVDGCVHEGREQYDEARDKALADIGILTMRFTNDEVLNDSARIISSIQTVIQERLKEGIKPFHGPVPDRMKRI
jgi:very-short-patch-repair endonuclease